MRIFVGAFSFKNLQTVKTHSNLCNVAVSTANPLPAVPGKKMKQTHQASDCLYSTLDWMCERNISPLLQTWIKCIPAESNTHTRSGSSMMSLSFPDASHWKCDDGRVPIMDEKDFQRYFRIFVCSEVKSSDCNGGISVQENLLEVLRWLWIKRCNLIPEHVLLKEPSSLFFFRKVLISQGFARSHAILCEACFFLYRGTSKSAQK